jgi:putative oxidoreductase
MMHGWPKIQNPMGWMGPDGFAPPFLQALAALSEFGGGLALIIGLLTPIASFGILCVAATAVTMVHLANGDPFVAPRGWEGGSYETPLLYLAIALLLILTGPGKLSLDGLLFDKKRYL